MRNNIFFCCPLYRIVTCGAVCLLLAACSALPRPPDSKQYFDLGMTETRIHPLSVGVRNIEVHAPSWLMYRVMQYRLDYQQPASRQLFRESQWMASPVEMLQRRLMAYLDVGSRDGNCILKLDLDEFIQTFSAPDQSETLIAMRGVFRSEKPAQALASRRFTIQQTAPTADARGGVAAYQAGALELEIQIAQWLEQIGTTDAARVCGLVSDGRR